MLARRAGRDLVHRFARIAGRVGVRDVRRHQRNAGLIDLQAGQSRRERLRETHSPAPVTDSRQLILQSDHRMTLSRSCDIWFAVVITLVFAE